MASRSRIEWTQVTWNPLTGCTKVSPGCRHCYAERFAERLRAMGLEKYRNGFKLTLHPDALHEPLRWRRPRLVFVNSMSDLFHERVPLSFIQRVFDVMRQAGQHRFQVLTKRSARLVEVAPLLDWPPNVWMGVSVETSEYVYRIEHLKRTGAAVKFLSCEPLLGPLPDLPLEGIDWVIVGGESGPGARSMQVEWVRQIRDQCLARGVAFFFKQWGGTRKGKAGRMLDGRTWDELPLHRNPNHAPAARPVVVHSPIVTSDNAAYINGFREKADLIWSLANLLRGDYKPHEYADVILPLVVLRRLDQAMAEKRSDVRAAYERYKGKLENLDPVLSKAADGSLVYNYSPFDWQTLLAAPNDLAQNLVAYLNAFSPEVQDIIEKFDFRRQVARLDAARLLYPVLKAFETVDLHPKQVSNHQMGLIFEELIRRFSEQYNETAGEHFTPREVIALMVELLLSEGADTLIQPGKIIEIYDPACGTGGMLTEAERAILERSQGLNPPPHVFLFGQEINPTAYAVAKADLLLKGADPRRLAFGNSFSEDGHRDKHFRLMLSNPPFGVEWKKVEHIIRQEHQTEGHKGRFGAGLPRISDGSLLFLQHMLAKRFEEDEVGSRIAIIFNGSPLFTGEAGSGESEIRRWIIENDWLEGIVALPEQLFYNTGIATYIWVLTNRKSRRRKGKVTLVNAVDFWAPMTPRSLGSKRRWISPEHRQRIVALYRDMEPNEHCRVFDNADFGYRRVRVERPLRLNFHASPARIQRLADQPAFKALVEDKPNRAAKAAEGKLLQEAILRALSRLPDQLSRDPAEFLTWLKDALAPLKLKEPLRKAILAALTERDERAEPVTDAQGNPEPDPELRDYENVPLKEDVRTYFEREVKPFVADAWIDESFRDERDKRVGVVGYEINFNRHFYRYTPPPHPADLAREIEKQERAIAALLQEWLR